MMRRSRGLRGVFSGLTAPGLNLRLVIAVAAVVAALDQAAKALALFLLEKGQEVAVIPGFFNLTLHFNPGAAFGLLANVADGQRQLVLAATTLVALACVIYLLIKDYLGDSYGQAALAMIMGGAVGNIIDRLRLGEVVDFLDFYIAQYHWPAFNLADSSICIGVAVLLFRRPGRKKAEKAA